MFRRTREFLALGLAGRCILAGGLGSALLAGQIRSQEQPAAATQPADELIALNLPDSITLKVLIDYVSLRLGINVIYDDSQVNQKVTLRAPAKVPRSALLGLLESVLRMRGLTLVDAEQAGWKRVVPLAAAAAPTTQAANATVGTRIFQLVNVEPQRLTALLKPLLTTPGGSSFELSEQRSLVVTDYASNLDRIAQLVQMLDRPRRQVAVEFLPVQHADAAQTAQQLEQILAVKAKTEGSAAQAEAAQISVDPRTSQLIVIASPEGLADAREILRSLDVPIAAGQSPMRFYKLANATSTEVLATIRALEGENQEPSAESATPSAPGQPQALMPRPAATENDPRDPIARLASREPASTARVQSPQPGQQNPAPGRSSPSQIASGSPGGRETLRTRNARVTADPNTNSIIVVAEPAAQRLYETLIRELDKRRPQVLLEATIVTLDTSNDFELGVEIGRQSGTDDNQVITFSSFGLSRVDSRTGRLALTPGAGFNGTLVSSDIADVVLRALSSHRRAKVVSAPRILVNDNSTGVLASIAEFPFTSVNASDTVATTSFGGYAEAGTSITLTPHISEADYLQLEYTIALNSFTGQGDNRRGVPPPRKTDSVQSKVTIPDGSTIIVGGLNRVNNSLEKNAIPFLGELPLLEYLFSNRIRTDATSTLFVFIRPVILRDDQFRDLRFISDRNLESAGLPATLPPSAPLLIR